MDYAHGVDDDLSDIVALPIDGTLDLHTFLPKEVKQLVPDYLQACREQGIFTVRIVHGKGQGQLRQTVHSVLAKLADVERFELAPPEAGGWGATIVILAPSLETSRGKRGDPT